MPSLIRFIFVFLAAFGSAFSFGQYSEKTIQKADSLYNLSKAGNPDTTRVWALLDMMDILYSKNVDTLLSLSTEVIEIVDPALERANDETSIFSLKRAKGDAYSNLGFYYARKGANIAANDYNMLALKIREEIKDSTGLANSYNNLGSYYNKVDDSEAALAYYRKSYHLRLADGEPLKIALIYNNIAYCHSQMKDYDSSIYYYNLALEIYENEGNQTGIARTKTNLGADFNAMGNKADAMVYYEEGYAIRKSRGRTSGLAYSALNLGNLHYELGNYSKSEMYGKEAYEIAFEIDHLVLKYKTSYLMYILQKRNGKYKQSLETYEQYIKLRDSVKNIEAKDALIKQEYNYEYEKKVAADSIKNAEEQKISAAKLDAEKAKNEKKEQQAFFLYLGLAAITLFSFLVLNRFIKTRKQKGIIEEQKLLVEEKNKEIIDSIEYAKRIQDAILPSQKAINEHLPNSFILYKPKDIVAGDFYWIEPTPKKDGILFAAADCTGHGVPGAMVSVLCHGALNRSVREFGLSEPGKILDKARDIVVAEFEKSETDVKDGMDIALCQLKQNEIHFAGAHNPLWVVRKDSSEVEEYKGDKQPIGKFAHAENFKTQRVKLNPGDSFYLFSDGYADQFGGEKGKKFKGANFKKLLLSVQGKTLEEQMKIIDTTFEEWRGSIEQLDDVCVIGVRV